MRVYTIGVGSAAGTTLTVNDFTVFTQLNEPMLQQIASMTDGMYFNAESADDLREIYQNLDLQVIIKPERTEITSIFTGSQYFVHADWRRVFAGVVQPLAVISRKVCSCRRSRRRGRRLAHMLDKDLRGTR